MATIFQTAYSNAFSWMKMGEFRLNFTALCSINNIPALGQILASRLLGAYMRHTASMSYDFVGWGVG